MHVHVHVPVNLNGLSFRQLLTEFLFHVHWLCACLFELADRDVIYGLVRRCLEQRLANDREQDSTIFIDRLLLDGRPPEEV